MITVANNAGFCFGVKRAVDTLSNAIEARREGERIILELKIPEAMHAVAKLPLGYLFENGKSEAPVTSGVYNVKRV